MGKVVKKVGKAIGSVFKAVGNFVGMLFSPPKVPKASSNASSEARLNASLVPEEPFKIIFGETAVGTDMRFWETYGAGNNGHVQVFAGACHEMTAYGNLYLDEKPVPFAGNAATGAFAGLLSRRLILKGVSGNGIPLGSGTRWTATSAMTGCSLFVLDWTYNAEKLPQGIPSRVTQVGKGAKVYDPRRDSTRGGAGAHRANDPATWEYTPLDSNGQPIGRNNALQQLTYQLGIFALSPVDGQWKLRGGKGVSPDDIDFASFIISANICEIEGWYSDCILSTGDSHSTNEGILEAAAGGELADTGGRFSYYVSNDDTANVAAYFTEDDIVGDVDWEPQRSMSEQFNELPGTFTDPTALFQTRPLPLCWSQEYYDADGYKKRAEPEKLTAVQDPVQGQKLLRRKLNKSRFQGVFSAPFNLRALKVKHHDIVRLTFKPFGWTNKLFRVTQQGIATKGGIQLVLEEESPAIYLPGAVVDVPAPGVGNGGDPFQPYNIVGFAAGATGVQSGASARDAMAVYFNMPGEQIDRTEGRYKKTGDANWTPLPPLRRDQNGWLIEPLLPTTNYTFQARHVTLWNVPGEWAQVTQSTNSVTVNPAGQMVYSNGQTVDSLRPGEAGANITENRQALTIYGQGSGATANNLLQLNLADGTKFNTISPGAGTSGVLTPIGQYSVVVGNSVSKIAGTHGQFEGGAVARPYLGTAFISSDMLNVQNGGGWETHLALDDDATSFEAGTLKYRARLLAYAGETYIHLYVNGVLTGNAQLVQQPLNQQTSRMMLAYDGKTVRASVDGVDYIKVDVAENQKLWPKVIDFYKSGTNLTPPYNLIQDVQHGPWSENAWSQIGGLNKPADNAGTVMNLIRYNPNAVAQSGNSLQKIAQQGWDGSGFFYSKERYKNGAVASFKRRTEHNGHCFVGFINTDNPNPPNVDSYFALSYGVHASGDGAISIYSGGTPIYYGPVDPDMNAVYSLEYDGKKVMLRRNGELRFEIPAAPEQNFALGGDIYYVGAGPLELQFKPFSNNGVSAVTQVILEKTDNDVANVGTETVPLGGPGWNTGAAYSRDAYKNSAYVAARAKRANTFQQFGLARISRGNPPPPSYDQIDYAWYVFGTNYAEIWYGGAGRLGVNVTDLNDDFSITYDGTWVRWFVNGVEKGNLQVIAGQELRSHFSHATKDPGAGFRDIRFGPGAQVARLGVNVYNNAGTTNYGDADLQTNLGQAQTIASQSVWATTTEPIGKISRLRANGRATNSYQVSNGILTGATLNRSPVYILGSSVQSGAARVSISAFSLVGAGFSASYAAGTIDGLAFNTVYYVYAYDPDIVGGTVSYVATTDGNLYTANPDYLFLDNITTVQSGGGNGVPPVPPRPPGYTDCVAIEAWLPTNQQAKDVEAGDRLLMLAADGSGMESGQVQGVRRGLAECMIFETVSGVTLTCSHTTPIPFKTADGVGYKKAWECDGSEILAVIDNDGFRWEALAKQPSWIGEKPVVLISANNGVYAAGNQKNRFIFTHNIQWKRPETVEP